MHASCTLGCTLREGSGSGGRLAIVERVAVGGRVAITKRLAVVGSSAVIGRLRFG